MTRQEFVDWLKDEVTISGALPVELPDKEYNRIIDREMKVMYEINPDAQVDAYCVIDRSVFYTPEFRQTRTIQFPDCVLSVTKVQELKARNSMFGIGDPDFGFNRAFMSDMWFGGMMNMDSVAFRTVQWSTWDQLKAFNLVDMQHVWDYASHKLLVTGHDPRVNVYCGLVTKADICSLYDNIWVQKWIASHCKLAINRLMTLYQQNIVGGVTLNLSAYVEEANKDIEECNKRFLQTIKIPKMYTAP